MTEITDEQVERAAKALYEASLDGPRNHLRLSWNDCPSRDYFMEQARIALEAAQETERSKWPTDDSVEEMRRMTEEAALLRAAMLVDTIIKAATQLAVSMENEVTSAPLAIPYGSAAARATMRKLVKDAGLLDD